MQNKLSQISFLFFLVFITILLGWILKPFVGVILWACIIAILFHPLQLRLEPYFTKRKNLLAVTILCIAIVSVILPLLGLISTLTQEFVNLYSQIQSGKIDIIDYIERNGELPQKLQKVLEHFDIHTNSLKQILEQGMMNSSRFIANQALQLGQNTTEFIALLALTLFLTFFIIRDGKQLVKILIKALPLGDEREIFLLNRISTLFGAVIRGNLIVATTQGTLGGLIFWILGVQAPLLWGMTMILSSLIPIVGAALIWLPVAIYLLMTGSIWKGVILIVFGAGVIGLIDNIMRPILVGRETNLPIYLILLSSLGGIATFGINGFILGPLILVLFISLWDIFIREFKPL